MTSQGYFTNIYHNSGSSGVIGNSGGTSASGGNSGLKSSPTVIQSNFLPCSTLVNSYGNGGNGTNNTSANNGQPAIIRYWFIA